MFGLAWHLTRNDDDALDIVQEIFLRAYRVWAPLSNTPGFQPSFTKLR